MHLLLAALIGAFQRGPQRDFEHDLTGEIWRVDEWRNREFTSQHWNLMGNYHGIEPITSIYGNMNRENDDIPSNLGVQDLGSDTCLPVPNNRTFLDKRNIAEHEPQKPLPVS